MLGINGIDVFPIGILRNPFFFFWAWYGAVIGTLVFLCVFEFSGNLKSSQQVAIFRKDGACIERNRYVASFPEGLISNWNNQIPYAIITVKFSFAVRVLCWDNFNSLQVLTWVS